MDCPIRQTATATPAQPGGLPLTLADALLQSSIYRSVHGKLIAQPSKRPPFLWYNVFSRQFDRLPQTIRKRGDDLATRRYRAATSAIGAIGRDGGPNLKTTFQRSRSTSLPCRGPSRVQRRGSTDGALGSDPHAALPLESSTNGGDYENLGARREGAVVGRAANRALLPRHPDRACVRSSRAS
jgi:hypothetical protein